MSRGRWGYVEAVTWKNRRLPVLAPAFKIETKTKEAKKI